MRALSAAWVPAVCAGIFVVGCSQTDPAAPGGPKPGEGKPSAAATPAAPDFESGLRPMLVHNCTPCHEGPQAKDGIDVTKVLKSDTAVLMKMVSEIEEGKMPPKTAKQLDPETKAKLLEGLKASTL